MVLQQNEAKSHKAHRQRMIVIVSSICSLALVVAAVIASIFVKPSTNSSSDEPQGPETLISVTKIKTSNQSVVTVGKFDLNQDYQLSMLFGNGSENQIVEVLGETEMSFDIPSSVVTSLRMHVDFENLYSVDENYGYVGSDEQMFNFVDYFMGDLGDVSVQLCNTKKNSNCSHCGSFSNVGRTGWSQINCTNGGTEANRILLKFSSLKQIHFKQLEIWGQLFVGNAVQSLPIRRGFSYGKRNEVTSSLVEKVIDLETPQSIDDCYVSPRGKKPWARFDIPWSLITHVDILNVPAGNDNRLEGIFVDVCIFGGTCKPCGVVTKTDLGKTSGVYCLGGLIEGNEIQLTHSYERLQFCELEAFGKKSTDDTRFVQLLSVNNYQAFAYWLFSQMYLPFNITYEMQALLDKKWSTELSDCIENGINPYVVLYVDRSVIRYVNLLNSEGVYANIFYATPEMKEGVNKVNVLVCESKDDVTTSGCELCGETEATPFASWATVFCGSSGIEGEVVIVNMTLFMPCEMEVFGIQIN